MSKSTTDTSNYKCRCDQKEIDPMFMSAIEVKNSGLPAGTEIIWNLSAAKTMLEVALQNLINGATASQFSNCKRARDILDETLSLL